jgi:dienelactone hydrolase
VPPDSRRDQAQQPQQPAPRVVDLKAADGTILKASHFAAAKPGPGVLLLHQSNRTRDSWDGVARQLAAAGIHTLTLDMRGFGESGGTPNTQLTDAERPKVRATRPGDVDTALQYLDAQPGVKRDIIGVGGAGEFGVGRSVEVARLHSAEVKSLVLLSGETLQDGLQFLRQASQLPGLFVVADDDEYPTILNQLWTSEGVTRVTQQLMEARRKDPQAQLFPEINVDIIGEDHVREGESERKAGHLREAKIEIDKGIEIFKLNLVAYPDSADAHANLADAYLKNGQKDLARQYAEKALAMIDSHKAPLSSWSDTEQRRAEIRSGVQDTLKELNAAH